MEKKGSKREREILEAAIRVFEKKGFNGATTKEIAQEAGIAEGTIFGYFPSKKDILHQILERVVDTVIPELAVGSLEQVLGESKGRSPEEAIRIVLHNRLNLMIEKSAMMKTVLVEAQYHSDLKQIYKEKVYLPIRHLLEQNIQELITAGIFRPIDVPTAAICSMGIFWSLMIEQTLYADENSAVDIDERISKIIDIVFSGARRVEEK